MAMRLSLLRFLAVRITVAVVVLALGYIALDQSEKLSTCREELRARGAALSRLERRVSQLEAERASRQAEQEEMRKWLERVAIPRDVAVKAAREDALRFFGGRPSALAMFDVRATLESDGWHVDFALKAVSAGGDLRYVINPLDGKIASRIIEQ